MLAGADPAPYLAAMLAMRGAGGAAGWEASSGHEVIFGGGPVDALPLRWESGRVARPGPAAARRLTRQAPAGRQARAGTV